MGSLSTFEGGTATALPGTTVATTTTRARTKQASLYGFSEASEELLTCEASNRVSGKLARTKHPSRILSLWTNQVLETVMVV